MNSPIEKQQLWFEIIISKMRIGFLPGVFLIGVIPVLLSVAITEGSALFDQVDLFKVFTNFIPYTIVNIFFMMYATKFIVRQFEKIREYSKQLLPLENYFMSNLPYSFKGLLISLAFVEVVSFSFDYAFISEMNDMSQGIIQSEISSIYIHFIHATFLWVFGSSMYCIYKMGKLPLQLKNYLEDFTLGLKPFGTACLKIIVMYVIAVLLTFPIFVENSPMLLTGMIMFLLLGIPFFFLPLVSLRTKLLKARKEHLDSINEKQLRIIKKINAENDGNMFDKELKLEILFLDKMKKDTQQIHRWPFDTTIFAQLVILIGAPVFVSVVIELMKRVSGL